MLEEKLSQSDHYSNRAFLLKHSLPNKENAELISLMDFSNFADFIRIFMIFVSLLPWC